MSVSKPEKREELVDYALRKLGAPVLEINLADEQIEDLLDDCLLYTSPSPRDGLLSRMPSSA